jgi:ATP-binding cassette subfamily B protein RaxB
MSHFVVLTGITRSWGRLKFHIHDPALGELTLPLEDVSRHWTGVALEFSKNQNFVAMKNKAKLKISQLWSSSYGLGSTLISLFCLAALLQIFAIIAPFYMQVSIDSVLINADQDLLRVLGVGFLALSAMTMLVTWLRSLILVDFSKKLSLQITENLFRHLIRLPASWFEKRHVGDIVSRFGSVKPITDLVSQGVISVILDGVMAIATLAIMLIYSARLALITFIALMTYIILKWLYISKLKTTNANLIAANARENSLFMETIRGIVPIKVFCREDARTRVWQSSMVAAVNAEITLGKVSSGFDAISLFIVGAERVIFTFVAISMAMDGRITVGMIFAFQAYKDHFLGSSTRLVDQAVNWNILQLHLERITDIAFSSVDIVDNPGLSYEEDVEVDISPKIELRSVFFSYGLGESNVLHDVNLTIHPGEAVAIVGRSGCGKTTLVKLILGLIEPNYGKIYINDVSLDSFGKAKWRKQVGYVAQDDALFAGTIADNVAFFDSDFDMTRVRKACEQASVANLIEGFPMKYDTLVGDMGSVLSGGQKQRILLARALYQSPKVIVLDEFTSHLDADSASSVSQFVNSLPITKIIITHRMDLIAAGTKIIEMRSE